MGTVFFICLVSVYVSLVMYVANRLTMNLESLAQAGLYDSQGGVQRLTRQKESLCAIKSNLQNEAAEIFTLYEITKEITKNLREDDAFEDFKQKLKEHVLFTKCYFLDSSDDELKELDGKSDCFVVALNNKQMTFGYLVVEGVSEDDREKVLILAHQFSLALRRVHLYQEIERIAITDSLTEVHTRRHITERFREELKRSKARRIKMSYLMIDVDFFKKFNDQYGHLTGDQILREVGMIIRENIREIDIAGRYGGEEFCVILPDTDRVGAQYAAERIRLASEKTVIQAYDATVNITVSVGAATFPEDGRRMDELIDKADWALYRAKKQGRNKVCSFGIYDNRMGSD